MRLKAYDYIRDFDGNIFVVRTRLDDGSIVAKPAYANDSSGLIKVTESPVVSPTGLSRILGGPDCVILPHDSVVRIDRFRPDDNRFSFLTDMLESRGAIVEPFGSRSLGQCKFSSDYDWLISYAGNLRVLISETIALAGNLRFFNHSDCSELARRYSKYFRMMHVADLTTVLERCCIFLKSQVDEIDFFGVTLDSELAIATNDNCRADLDGIILPASGKSFGMPRAILVRNGNQDLVLRHIAWPLSGLECLEGSRIVVQGAFKLKDGTFWMSQILSTIRLEMT